MDKILEKLATEQPNPNTTDIDLYSTYEVLKAISDEDKTVAFKVADELDAINSLTECYIETINNGGRIFYMGCGTSGRLAYIDAAELIPTYNVPEDLVIPIMAGGLNAMRRAKEFAEDQEKDGINELKANNLTNKDFVIGIAASGRTPFVVEGLKYAKELGCKTGCIVCNKNTVMGSLVDYPIEIETGPEIVRGSTRMKSATAQKLTLNMISSTVFIRLGATYKNLLMNSKATTYKAEQRHIRTLISEANVSEEEAISLLKQADEDPKIALTMALTKLDIEKAKQLLKEHNNRIREAVNKYNEK